MTEELIEQKKDAVELTTNPQGLDLAEQRLFNLGWGLVWRWVCVPASWTPERVSEEATRIDPPGTSVNRWEVSEARDERPNQMPCPDCADRTHWLINC
jgi:hypothetical protein